MQTFSTLLFWNALIYFVINLINFLNLKLFLKLEDM